MDVSPISLAAEGSKQVCNRCLYDDRVPKISFDDSGICSYCKLHDQMEQEYPNGPEGERRLAAMVDEIRRAGKGKPYDCVVGVSGGCDSTYLLYRMKQYGLRPLAAYFDNTWTTTAATMNIRNATEALGVDLYTHVANNREYDDIYRAFIAAGVPDIEGPTDLALAATHYHAAAKFGIRHIIEGHSFRTEGISPLGWLYMDAKYVQSVHRKFGERTLTTIPQLWLSSQLRWMIVNRIKKVRPLYFMNYNKAEAMELMKRELGWQWYGGHHLDNRFTAFYHRYYMPVRFGIDQRVLGCSALMRSGQMTRDEALAEMATPPHLNPDIISITEFVKKRLGYSNNEFISLMEAPRHSYKEFVTYKKAFERLRPLFWLMYKLELVPKSFYIKFTAKD
ncbi:MAG: N-acetyl sugar amidotransferase [Alphaproteobacteria bacterium]|nr:N-acetyl sugar amidotransferase [Alphaproteobacteria bacterium]